MRKNNEHIIQTVNLEINTNSESYAHAIKNNINNSLNKLLSSHLEDILNRYCHTEHSILIENLNIEFDVHSNPELASLEAKISENIELQLSKIIQEHKAVKIQNKEQIIKNLPSNGRTFKKSSFQNGDSNLVQTLTKEQSFEKAFFFFLENGSLPWFISRNKFEERVKDQLLHQLFNQDSFKLNLKTSLLKNKRALDRFILQFNKETIDVFKKEIIKINAVDGKNLCTLIDEKIDLLNKKTSSTIKDIEEVLNNETSTDNKIYSSTAGIILTHPFLAAIFNQFNLLDENKNIPEDKKAIAVHLLHYIATGEEQAPEHELQFEKYLCNLPDTTPLARYISLTKEMKAECNNLLKALIQYWPELKNTSPESLREMFLKREGVLNLQQDTPKLNIERKAQDILLNKLQWNISLVKLPWIENLLMVEW